MGCYKNEYFKKKSVEIRKENWKKVKDKYTILVYD